MASRADRSGAQAGASVVLLTLAAGQFLMTLDTSVMNVAIATVAEDVGTDVTGIQTAITLYTLVMATLMITGGKIGALIGRKRAFAIGCVIYGAGSFTTSIAPSLPVLLIGWSVLEGVGAALILPAIVALVAANFGPEGRPRAYGLVMAAGAIAVAVGPLIGGLFTTYLSWRLVFAGEVLIVLGDPRADAADRGRAARASSPGSTSSASCCRRRAWVWRSSACCARASGAGSRRSPTRRSCWASRPRCGSSSAGSSCVWLFFAWESRIDERGGEPSVRPSMLKNVQMRRWPAHVLLPVLRAVGRLLRRAAVPVGLARAVGDRHRRPAPAALGDAPDRSGRDPTLSPGRQPAPRRSARAARDARRHRRAARRHRRGGLRRDRDPAAAAAGLGDRRARIAARRRHGVRRARRAEPRRSAACRTPRPTSAPRSEPRWPGRC